MAVATGRARYLRVAGSARQGRELVRGACGRPYSAERPQDEQSRRARASSARRAARTGHRAAPAQAKRAVAPDCPRCTLEAAQDAYIGEGKVQRPLTAPDVHWRQHSTPSARRSGNATQRRSSAKRAPSALIIGEHKRQWPRAAPDVHWRQRRRTGPRARHQRPRRETLASTSYSNCTVHQRQLVCPGSRKYC